TNSGLARTGSGTGSSPYKVKLTDGTAIDQILKWDGSKWTLSTITEQDGTVGNEVLNATTGGGLTRAGSGTTGSPYTLGLQPGTSAGQTLIWDGTTWNPVTAAEQ